MNVGLKCKDYNVSNFRNLPEKNLRLPDICKKLYDTQKSFYRTGGFNSYGNKRLLNNKKETENGAVQTELSSASAAKNGKPDCAKQRPQFFERCKSRSKKVKAGK